MGAVGVVARHELFFSFAVSRQRRERCNGEDNGEIWFRPCRQLAEMGEHVLKGVGGTSNKIG